MPIDSAVKPMSDTSSARAPVTAAGQLLDTGVDGHPRQRRVDVAERLVGLEEEVAGHADSGEPAVHLLEVDRHELASGDLVLTTHASHNTARRVRMPGASLARLPPRALGPVRRAPPRALEPRLLGHDVVGRALVRGRAAAASRRRRRPARRARGAASRGRGARIASPREPCSRTWTWTWLPGSQPPRNRLHPVGGVRALRVRGVAVDCRGRRRSPRRASAARTSSRSASARRRTPTWTSMTSLAMRPGTDVEPMCDTSVTTPVGASAAAMRATTRSARGSQSAARLDDDVARAVRAAGPGAAREVGGIRLEALAPRGRRRHGRGRRGCRRCRARRRRRRAAARPWPGQRCGGGRPPPGGRAARRAGAPGSRRRPRRRR